MLFLLYRKTVKAKLKAKFLQSLADRRLSVSRDKGQRSRFQNKFYATLIFTAIKECKIKLIMLMALSKHIPEIERQSYTLYREKSVHTLARKHVNLNLSAWSLLLLQAMQNKMKNNVNPYRSLQVMHVRLRRFNSSLVK